MKVNSIKCGFAFARNPIALRQTWASAPLDMDAGRMIISMGGTDIFEGRFTPPLMVDISEIIDAYVQWYPEPPKSNESPILQVVDTVDIEEWRVYCEATYNDEPSSYEFTALPGGVSTQNYCRYLDLDTDAFESRFFNYRGNFFLTTRTAGWQIAIKETELYPLYFYLHGQDDEITVKELVGGKSMTFGHLENGVYIFDVENLRREFFSTGGVLANMFDIYVAGQYACRIVVERAECSRDRCRVRFRNSLGVFEVIELTGKIKMSSEYDSAEDAIYMHHNTAAGGFRRDRERIARSQTVTVETGAVRQRDLNLLADMLGSEEVYLLDVSARPAKVIPSAENIEHDLPIDSPASFSIAFKLVDDEQNITAEIAETSDSMRPRLFSDQFNNKFN